MKTNGNFNIQEAISNLKKLTSLTHSSWCVPVGLDKRPVVEWKKEDGSYLSVEEAIKIAQEMGDKVAGFGLGLHRNLIDIDKDIPPTHPASGKLWKILEIFFGDVAKCVWGRKQDPYRHILILSSGFKENELKPIVFPSLSWEEEGKVKQATIEFRNGNRYVIIPPSKYGEADEYVWGKKAFETEGVGFLEKEEFIKRYKLLKLVALLEKFYNDTYRQKLCFHLTGWLDRFGFTSKHMEQIIEALETLKPGRDPLNKRLDVIEYLQGKDKTTGFPSLVEEVLKPQGATDEEIANIQAVLDGSKPGRKQARKKNNTDQPNKTSWGYSFKSPILEALHVRQKELVEGINNDVLDYIRKLKQGEQLNRYSIFPYELLLSGGVKYIAGAPKTGKSFLATQLALGLAKGSFEVLGGSLNLNQPLKVLYFALDERLDIIPNKFMKLVSLDELEQLIENKRLEIIPRLTKFQTYQDLLEFEERIKGYDVVFIDMVSSLFDGDNLTVLEAISRFLEYLETLSDRLDRKITFFCLDHTAKPVINTSNPMDLIRGGAWMSGKVTDVLIFYKKRNRKTKKEDLYLHITGRTVKTTLDLKLVLEAETGEMYIDETTLENQLGWKEKFQEVSKQGRTFELLVSYFLSRNNEPATIGEILQELGIKRETVKSCLKRHKETFVKQATSKYATYYYLNKEAYKLFKQKKPQEYDLFLQADLKRLRELPPPSWEEKKGEHEEPTTKLEIDISDIDF